MIPNSILSIMWLTNIRKAAIIRGDSTKKQIALVFTGDEFGDGLSSIAATLNEEKVKGSFFLTGRFYRNKEFSKRCKKTLQPDKMKSAHIQIMHLCCTTTGQTRNKHPCYTGFFPGTDLQRTAGSPWSVLGIKTRRHDRYFFIPPYEWWNKENCWQ
jgi:endoglucanase